MAIVGRWKEHFEELLNPPDIPSVQEADLEQSGESEPISVAEVPGAVRELIHQGGKKDWEIDVGPW